MEIIILRDGPNLLVHTSHTSELRQYPLSMLIELNLSVTCQALWIRLFLIISVLIPGTFNVDNNMFKDKAV